MLAEERIVVELELNDTLLTHWRVGETPGSILFRSSLPPPAGSVGFDLCLSIMSFAVALFCEINASIWFLCQAFEGGFFIDVDSLCRISFGLNESLKFAIEAIHLNHSLHRHQGWTKFAFFCILIFAKKILNFVHI